MTIKVAYLKDYQEYITAVAHWSITKANIYEPITRLKDRIEKFKGQCNTEKLPLTLIAIGENERLIGMATLKETEIATSKLGPWLSGLYVLPAYEQFQGTPILIDAIKEKAKQLNYLKLYTVIPTETAKDYYLKLNWTFNSNFEAEQQTFAIMEYDLKA